MGKSDSMEHLPDVIAHKGDIAFHGGSLILWEPERAEMPRSGNFRELVKSLHKLEMEIKIKFM